MNTQPYIVDATLENFNATVLETSGRVPVLMDFWASWCGPCRMLLPVVTRLAEEYQGQFVLAKVNIDEQPELANRFAVRSVPTVKLIRQGQVMDEFLGVQPEAVIRELVERYLERESDRTLATARELMAAGELEQALSLLERAQSAEPNDSRLVLALAEALLLVGEVDRTQALVDTLPMEQRNGPEAVRLIARMTFLKVASDAPPEDELKRRIETDPGDSEARYRLAARLIVSEAFEPAMEQLLELVRRDRAYGNDAGRTGLLKVFELLGGSGELVSRYRGQMFNILH